MHIVVVVVLMYQQQQKQPPPPATENARNSCRRKQPTADYSRQNLERRKQLSRGCAGVRERKRESATQQRGLRKRERERERDRGDRESVCEGMKELTAKLPWNK